MADLATTAPPFTLLEVQKAQLQQAVDTYRVQITLLTQILTAFVIANVSVIGYAVSAHVAGVVAVGAIFPLGSMFVIRRVSRLAIPLFYTAINIEKELGGSGLDGLVTTLLCFTHSVEYVESLRKLASLAPAEDRFRKLKEFPTPHLFGVTVRRHLTFPAIALAQLVAAGILHVCFCWPIFGK